MPFDLQAKTSVIIRIKVRKLKRVLRGTDTSCLITLSIKYHYICNTKISKSIEISFGGGGSGGNTGSCGGGVGWWWWLGGSGRGGAANGNGHYSNCESRGNGEAEGKDKGSGGGGGCVPAVFKCLFAAGPIINFYNPLAGLAISTMEQIYDLQESINDNYRKYKRSLSNKLREKFSKALPIFEKWQPIIELALDLSTKLIECQSGISENCGNSKRAKRSLTSDEAINIYSPFLYKHDLAPVFAEALVAIHNINELLIEVFGQKQLLNDSISQLIKQFQLDSSENGEKISENEYKLLEKSMNTTNRLDNLMKRINNTVILQEDLDLFNTINTTNNYMNLTLIRKKILKYKSDLKRANEYGFWSIFDWLKLTANAFDQAPIRKGVCAKVIIRLSQHLVLTREIFEAELQMFNTEVVDLTSVNISLRIKRVSNNDNKANMVLMSDLYFHMSEPTLISFSSIDGQGILRAGDRGVAKWLLTPTKLAAPTHSIDYIVDGFVKYKLNNTKILIEIYPERITVSPDPSLTLIYFLEKYVQSDDPLTTGLIEPKVPFVLGLLIVNNGYGVAKNLKIQTSQPEIIENKSGLLIDFSIISFYLNNVIEASSLNVFIGNVKPFEVKHAIWYMESTLKGTFSRLNATLVNENQFGDKQLSLIDQVEYKQLLKAVKLDKQDDDDLVDFLVIEKANYKVYSSNNPLHPLNVVYILNTTIIYDYLTNALLINLKLELVYDTWYLTHVKLNGVNLNGVHILDTIRSDDGSKLSKENVWLNQFEEEYTWIVSIFDFNKDRKSLEYKVKLSEKINLKTAKTTKLISSTNLNFSDLLASNYTPNSKEISIGNKKISLKRIFLYVLFATIFIVVAILIWLLLVICKSRRKENKKKNREKITNLKEDHKLIE